MHYKKIYINKSMYSIQGLRTVSNSLPRGLKTILKKGGHNYSSIIYNWSNLVGKKISSVCYPKSVKTDRELKNGILVLNVFHGDQILVEYSKKDIVDKINAFFGYQFIKDIRIVLIKEKINKKRQYHFNENQKARLQRKVEKIGDSNLKKNLTDLINVFNRKK
tara:strand:- start:4037 stop:4525 length:489 start_codon:yes stop_codon:yes gene_type:complete